MDHQPHDDIAARIRGAVDDARLDPSVRARHLHAIRHRAASLPAPTGSAPRRRLAGLRRLVASGATAALVLVATTGAAVAASTDALPDDSLYGVKRTTETIRLRFAGDEAAFRLELVDRRLDEAEAIVAGQGSAGGLARVLRDAGLELAAIDDDRATTTARAGRAADRLADLLSDGLPPHASAAAHSALQHALDTAGRPDIPPGQDPDFTPLGQDRDDHPGKGPDRSGDPGKGPGSGPSSGGGTSEPGGSAATDGAPGPAETPPPGAGPFQTTPPDPQADPPGRDDDARPPRPPQPPPPPPPSPPGTGRPDGAGPPPGAVRDSDDPRADRQDHDQDADRPGQAQDPPGKGGNRD